MMRGRPALVTGTLCALLVPPLACAANGGADLHLWSWRVSFYDAPVPAAMLLGVIALAWARPSRDRRATILRDIALASFVLGVASIYQPWEPRAWYLAADAMDCAQVGWFALLMAWLAGRRSPAGGTSRAVARPVILGLAAGAALWAGFHRLDRAHIAERLASSVAPRASTDVILIVVDTLRADALELGLPDLIPGTMKRAETPNLARLAAESLVFRNAIAPAPWTVPSMGALFTGLHPSTIDPQGKGASMSMAEAKRRPPLHPDLPRLARALRAAGYVTTGYVKNPLLAPGRGFEPGFGLYERVGGDSGDGHSARQLVDAALRWADPMQALRERDADRPYFLYLHFMDPHVDYVPPDDWWSPAARAYEGPVDGHSGTLRDSLNGRAESPYEEDRAQYRELYAGEVGYLDHQLGRLLAGLAERGLYSKDTTVVFTSDHGEQFGEHGSWEHGDLHVENVRVPLLLRAPDIVPGVRDEMVSLLDVAPTVLERLGLPPLPHAEGRALPSDAPPVERVVVTEYGDRRRVSDGRWALLDEGALRRRLYDLAADPGETRDVAAEHTDEVLRLAAAYAQHTLREPLELTETAPVDTPSRDLDAIRELGYAGDDTDR
jgi:arylsulfatase A-like enzyme